MRIIIDFDDAQNPTIKLERSQSSTSQVAPTTSVQGSSNGIDAGQAPAEAMANMGEIPASGTLMSNSMQNMATQPGMADSSNSYSAGPPVVHVSSNE